MDTFRKIEPGARQQRSGCPSPSLMERLRRVNVLIPPGRILTRKYRPVKTMDVEALKRSLIVGPHDLSVGH